MVSDVVLRAVVLFAAIVVTYEPAATQSSCTPQVITSGQTIQGTITSADCRSRDLTGNRADFYSFRGTAGQRVTISMDRGTLDDPYLYLYGPDEDDDELVDDDDSGSGNNALISNFTLPTTGTHVIEAAGGWTDSRGTYTLRMTLSAPSATCPATSVTVGQIVNGSLVDGDCSSQRRSAKVDRYTLRASAGQRISVTMDRGTLDDAYLYIVGPLGAPETSRRRSIYVWKRRPPTAYRMSARPLTCLTTPAAGDIFRHPHQDLSDVGSLADQPTRLIKRSRHDQ